MDSDVLHPAGKEKEWNESLYFNLYDKSQDLCLFMRIGLKPNANERSVFCFIMMPDGSLVGTKDQDAYSAGPLAVKGLRFEKVEAEKVWQLTFKGHMGRLVDGKPQQSWAHIDYEWRIE